MTPEETVRSFLDHLVRGEAQQALELLDHEVEWRNTGLPTLRGRRVHRMLEDLIRRGVGFEVEWHHIGADGGTVLTDRTDKLSYKRWEASFPTRGTFQVRDGRITVWDDFVSWSAGTRSAILGLARLRR